MHWSSAFAHRFDLDACCVYLPRCIGSPGVAAFEGVASGSAYADEYVADAALSEYIERRHFRHHVRDTGLRRLADMDSLEWVLQGCYQQVRRSSAITIPDALPGCSVLRWRDWEPVHIPRNLIGLGAGETDGEFELHPWRDSAGMACHRSDLKAMEAAALEFVERQTALAWWLGGGSVHRIDPETVAQLAPRSPSGTRWEALVLDAGLGAFTVLAAGECREGGFSATATRLSPLDSLRKALQEADHFRAFLGEKQRAVADGRGGNRYERAAVASGSHGMPDRVRFALVSAPVLDATVLRCIPAQALAEVRDRIHAVSSHVYVYLAHEASVLGQHSLARVVSPDFYLHGDPGVNLNFANAFACRLGIGAPLECQRTSTCFP